jgi:hypothetical protein
VARQSPNRNEADEPAADAPATSSDDTELTREVDTDDSPAVDGSLWDKVRISPVEIALPAGTGFTLRAYRRSSTLTPTTIDDRLDDDPFDVRARQAESDEDGEEEVVILDEEFAALLEEDDKDAKEAKDAKADDRTDEDDEPPAGEFHDDEPDEDVPVFLSNRGRLLMFKSPETLVAFVRSGASHDMAQLDTWTEFAERVQPADIVPREDDTYELDLVVENLRGGHDTWDLDLLIEAGEVARDLAYALRLRPVLTGLSAGSPLDDLDEALRSAASGGVGGFMGRRRLRKIGAQQASLGWRAIIGKISAAVDWRD